MINLLVKDRDIAGRAFYRFIHIATVLLSMLISLQSFAQSGEALQLQQQIQHAIARSSLACVRIWGFDTLQNQRNSGQFSGVVVKDNYIFTAAHVVTPGNTYRVMFADGRNCIAVALGEIEFSEDKTRPDVALMRIVTKGNWPFAEIGRSDSIRPGDPCISIAYPESLNQDKPTARFGYITNTLNERGFIKSTCIMEPGDSGGPLFDIEGRIIGIHSAIEEAEQSNYDVPVDLYKKYRTALLTETVYDALPKEDAIKEDPPGRKASTNLLNDKSFNNYLNSYKHTCVLVTSKIKGQVLQTLGTVISLRGTPMESKLGTSVIVSKNSAVGDSVLITVDDVKHIAARVLIRDKATDLILLGSTAKLSGGIAFKELSVDALQGMKQGALLISRQADTSAVVSILGSGRSDLPKISSAGFLGATATFGSNPAKIYFVRAGSPAALGGIRVGDVVKQVNGMAVESESAYAATILKCWPGDTVRLHINRNDAEINQSLILTYPPQMKYNHPAENFAGGKSLRRDGFTGIYINEAVIKPEQCAGPVFNLDNQFCGIQIARFSRANSILIGADCLLILINNAFNANNK